MTLFAFPKQPQPWSPEDWDGPPEPWQQQAAEREYQILIWKAGYDRLSRWERFKLSLGLTVYVPFEIVLAGMPGSWGIYESPKEGIA